MAPVPPTPRAPSPFRKHARDIRAISLVASGIVVLLSLQLGGRALALGSFLHALLGWGAPAMGAALILLGLLVAAGTDWSGWLEVRVGGAILLGGMLVFAGLLHRSPGARVDGGDLGNGLAAGLVALLGGIVGDRAAPPCAQAVVGALNLVGFLMVTDRPLMHWARLARLFGHWAVGRWRQRPRLARSPRDAADNMGLPEIQSYESLPRTNSRGRGGAAVSAADALFTLPDPITSLSRTIPSREAALAMDADSEGSQSAGRPGFPRSLESLGDCETPDPEATGGKGSERPTVIRGVKKTPGKNGFAAALEALLPPANPEPHQQESLREFLHLPSESPEPGGLMADESTAAPGRRHEVLSQSSEPGDEESSLPAMGDAAESDAALMDSDGQDFGAGGDLDLPRSRCTVAGASPVEGKRPAPKPVIPAAPRPRSSGEALPPSTLLTAPPPNLRKTAEEAQATVMTLERTLQEFKVEARVVEIAEGPTLTRYEIQLAPGILVKKILSLADNISMALAAIDVRVEAPIPGKCAIGIEVPKRTPGMVALKEMVEAPEFRKLPGLSFALGRDVTGAPQYADLSRMPHLLIAGSTGSGKSACLNTLITSLLFRCQPEELQFVMVDPKRVELSLYDGIPHLCHQIVRDCRRAPQALGRVMAEMDRRYLLLQEARTRDLTGYNQKAENAEQRLPYIVVVIDELADLMMTSGAETEHAITRLAQLARAVGIHLVVATQRPSVDIVTGKIKANISSRIAFAVSSGVDSRTILDSIGAERLIGRGDMLFLPIEASKPKRIQGAYIGEREVEQVVEFWKEKGRPDYYLERTPVPGADLEPTGDAADEFYTEAVRVVINAGQASTSMLQRRLKIGYNRAATLIELMEEHGVVGPQDGVRPREVLVSQDQWDLMHGGE